MAGSVIAKVAADGGTHSIASSFYGTCATAKGTKAKAVILSDPNIDNTTLVIPTGTLLTVKFTAENTASSPTLTLYNNTGTAAAPTAGTAVFAAKSIKRYGTTATGNTIASSWRAGAIVAFVYDGTYWVEISSIDDNTTYTNISLGNCIATSSTAAEIAAKEATPISGTYTLATNGIVSVRFTDNNTAAAATLNIGAKGAKPIFYRGSALTTNTANIWDVGATVTFYYDGTNYNIIAIDTPKKFILEESENNNFINNQTDFILEFSNLTYFANIITNS